MTQTRDRWNSQIGFLFAAVGSAIGLGNIWRFSYMCHDNGGGAFLVPYFIALLAAGIPLMLLEYGFGHAQGGSAPLSFAKVGRKSETLGWFMPVMVMFVIMLYYSVVIAWCLNYLVFSFDLSWGDNTESFFYGSFLKLSEGPGELGDVRLPILLSSLAVWVVIWLICFKKVSHGIERACKIFMPTLFVLTAILVVWGLQLDGATEGLRYYLRPDWGRLREWKVWNDAFGQIFFSLSLGFGIMIAYASYLPKRANIVQNAYLTSAINCGYSLFAGLAVFSVLGYMAQVDGVPIKDVVAGGPGLAFIVYPRAISLLPAFNSLFGVVFFLTLVIAGISSGISIIEALGSAIQDKFAINRFRVITLLCVTGFLGSLVFCLQGGLYWLDILDHYSNNYGLVLAGFLECLIVGWAVKTHLLRKHINEASVLKINRVWDFSIKFITPVILFAFLVGALIREFSSRYEGYSLKYLLIGAGWILILLGVAAYLSRLSWRKGSLKREHSPRGGKLLT